MTGLSLAFSEQPNLAPADGLRRAQQTRAQDKTVFVGKDWFSQTKNQYQKEEEQVWQSQTLLWEMIFLFIEGKQLLKRGRYTGGWRTAPIPDRTDSPVYGQNLVGFFSDNIKAKWTQSNTDVNWRPTSDRDEAVGAAKAADYIFDFFKRKLYTERFKQTEATLAQCGKYARYYYYSDEEKSVGRRPKIEQQQVQFGDGSWFCADCGMSGSAAELGTVPAGHDEVAEWEQGLEAPHAPELEPYEQDEDAHLAELGATMGANGVSAADAGLPEIGGGVQCPACGSPNIEIEEVEPLEVEAVTGYEEVELGDLVCEPVPAFELKHDLTKNPQNSPYLIRRRRVRVALLESKFPDLAIKAAKGESAGLQAEDDLKRSVYNSANSMRLSTDLSDEPTADFVQIWLDPCLYSRVILKEDFQTLRGETIPAGTRLLELFPDGMYSAWIEGIEGCVELRNEHHKDYWVGGEYRLRAISALGSGIEDMIEGQRQYNLIMSIIYTQLRTSAMPATLYDQRLLPNGVSSYLGSLKNIPVEMAALDDRLPISAAVHQLSPQPPTAAHFQYGNDLNIFLQKASRVTDVGFGQALGLDNKTATGAQLAAANAQGLFGPQLALKAEVDRVGAELILKLFKKYGTDERYISLSGKRGEQDGIWLSQADVDVELFAEVANESFLPQTNFERRQRWQEFLLNFPGGLMGLKMAMNESPALVEQMAEMYDVDLAGEDYTAAAELSRQRIDQMAEALPMLQLMMQQMPPTKMEAVPDPVDPMAAPQYAEVPVDPMAEAGQFLLGILVPPIEVEELGHMQAIAYCRDWLTTDEGKKAPQELREGVKAMIAAHVEGVMAEAQIMGLVGMAGQPMPAMPEQDADGQKPPKKSQPNTPDANASNPAKRPSSKPKPQAAMA
ncbi:MAG: hypothetical protein E6Q97_19145 [Desulfurellales bacterium]|nr:MAG: hypothetical protein E6Q97_19145 [Desulfurellales bacterium]